MQFDYEKERGFYCERIQRNCPFDSKFRYCLAECDELIENKEKKETIDNEGKVS